MSKLFTKYYYKTKIIITLSMVTALLLIVMSRISYYFVENLYLEQLREKITITATMLSNQIDTRYLSILELGMQSTAANDYFEDIISRNITGDLHAQVSIFNSDYNTIIDSDTTGIGGANHELLLFKNEINSLEEHKSITTTPFEGNDGNWYLYGFYKFNNNFTLGIKAHAKRFERIENFNLLFWFIGIGGTILIGVISWLLASSLTKPLYKLVDFSKKIGDNDFNTAAPENIKGEIQILVHALDNMRHNIAANHKEREDMLAQIAHEIRNPLGGIELLAELTKEDLEKNNLNPDYQKRILDEIYKLKSLIASYLNYGKPAPANPDNVEIAPLLDEIEQIFRVKLDEKNIELKKNYDYDTIYFDRDQLRQVLINLISNSIDAIPCNGTINVNAEKNSHQLTISVSDNGSGIEEKNIDKLFEPFFTTRENGTGLGLAICKKFCIENNSSISVTNNDSGGVTFKLTKRDLS